jgi:hypothetical protein
MGNPLLKLLDRVRQSIRLKGYSVRTTMIYPHVLNRGGRAVVSPLD